MNPSVFSSLNMLAQRSAVKSLDKQRSTILALANSSSSATFKRSRGSAQLSHSKTNKSSNAMLPIHTTKKYKSFPKLVNLMANPFSQSQLNFGINSSKAYDESMRSTQFNLGDPTTKQLKSRSNYYKTCKGCSVNINRLVITRSIDRPSQYTITPAEKEQE